MKSNSMENNFNEKFRKINNLKITPIWERFM